MSKKEMIVEVASRLFAEKGFTDTSVSDITKITGVSTGTIFYYFKTKEDLLLFILKRLRERILEEFDRYAKERETSDGLEMVEQAVSFYLYLAGKMEDQFLLLHQSYLYQFAQANVTFREHLQEIYNCLIDIFEETIAVGQKDGSIREGPTRKMALLLFTMVDGLVRFRSCNLYDASALYTELMVSCRQMLENRVGKERCKQ